MALQSAATALLARAMQNEAHLSLRLPGELHNMVYEELLKSLKGGLEYLRGVMLSCTQVYNETYPLLVSALLINNEEMLKSVSEDWHAVYSAPLGYSQTGTELDEQEVTIDIAQSALRDA
jgi:hypothetical protein